MRLAQLQQALFYFLFASVLLVGVLLDVRVVEEVVEFVSAVLISVRVVALTFGRLWVPVARCVKQLFSQLFVFNSAKFTLPQET